MFNQTICRYNIDQNVNQYEASRSVNQWQHHITTNQARAPITEPAAEEGAELHRSEWQHLKVKLETWK